MSNQHTYGSSGNIGTASSQNVNQESGQSPLPPPQVHAEEPTHGDSFYAPGATTTTSPQTENIALISIPSSYTQSQSVPGYASNMPRPPPPAYSPFVGGSSTESPDLLAARRELKDIETQIKGHESQLNTLINHSSPPLPQIESLRLLLDPKYNKQRDLKQRIRDLQDPNTFAYQQSQALTAADGGGGRDDPHGEMAFQQAQRLESNAVVPRKGGEWNACMCILAIAIIIAVATAVAVTHSRNRLW